MFSPGRYSESLKTSSFLLKRSGKAFQKWTHQDTMVLLQLHVQQYASYTLYECTVRLYATVHAYSYISCLQTVRMITPCKNQYRHNTIFGLVVVRWGDSEPTKGFPTVNQLTGGNCLVCPARVLQFGAASTVVNTSGDTSNRKSSRTGSKRSKNLFAISGGSRRSR